MLFDHPGCYRAGQRLRAGVEPAVLHAQVTCEPERQRERAVFFECSVCAVAFCERLELAV